MHLIKSFISKWLERIVRTVCHFPIRTVGIAAVLFVISLYLTFAKLGVLNNTNDLIDQDSKDLNNWLGYLEEFQTKDPMVIVFESPDVELNKKAAEEVAQRINKRPEEIAEVFFKIDFSPLLAKVISDSPIVDKMKPHLLLYEDEKKLEEILETVRAQKSMLSGEQLEDAQTAGVNLNSVLEGALKKFDEVAEQRGSGNTLDELDSYAERMVEDLHKLQDELGAEDNREVKVSDLGMDNFENEMDARVRQDMERELSQLDVTEYLSFEDGKLLLMMLTPGEGNQDSFAPFEVAISNLRLQIREVEQIYPGVSIGLTGEPVLLDDELKQSEADMIFAASLAFVLIALIFFIAYHEIVRPLLALTALVFSLFCSLGFTVLSVGHLNIISQAFVLMLMGLGIDFGIQILGRYEEERVRGKNVEDAIAVAIRHTGSAVLIGGGITAAAFFTMCFNDFKGLGEMGLIAGAGIIFCLIGNLLLLPAFLVLKERGSKSKIPQGVQTLGKFGVTFDKRITTHPGIVLGIAGLITMIAALQIKNVKFDYNLLNLQHPEMPAVKWVHRLLNSDVDSFTPGIILADDLEDAKVKTEKLLALPTVKHVNSPIRIMEEMKAQLPDEFPNLIENFLPENQETKLLVLHDLRRELDSFQLNLDVTSRLDVAKAKQHLTTLLQYSKEGLAESRKVRLVSGRAKKALKIFEELIPTLEQSLKLLSELDQEEASRRLSQYQIKLFKRIEQEFAYLKNMDLENAVTPDFVSAQDINLNNMTLEDLPEELKRRYISPNKKILLEVVPKENIWEREPNERFVKDLKSIDPNATGTPVQSYVYIKTLKDSYVIAALWALLAIVVLVGLHFRKISSVFITLLPLGVGIIWTLGIMGATGIQFNLANIITLPLVIGIGVAYGVYVVDRYEEEGEICLFGGSTGKAILLSAMTTIIGFGCMMTGKYVGLVSLGMLMSIGISFCFLASIIILPQVLKLTEDQYK
ncbi:MAG: MMPL family transporter [Verrucomicrobiota bacterium]